MITKENLAKFIKESVKEAPFDGCAYIDLDCEDKDSNELYLVFACDSEDGILCKIAYNCDDLQCDYDWDWTKPEELDYECDHCDEWADSYADRAAEWIVDSELREANRQLETRGEYSVGGETFAVEEIDDDEELR